MKTATMMAIVTSGYDDDGGGDDDGDDDDGDGGGGDDDGDDNGGGVVTMVMGHVSRACRSKGDASKPQPLKPQGTHRMQGEEGNSDEEDAGPYTLYTVKSSRSPPYQVNIELNDVVNSYPQLFEEGLGTLKGKKARIHVDPSTKPEFYRARPVPYTLREKIEQELERLQKEGTIEPVQYSEWATPIVPVVKSDGTIRLCGDYKLTVNKVSTLDAYPIPKIDDLYTKLAGGKTFTELDLSHAYEQMLLDDDSKQRMRLEFRRSHLKAKKCNFMKASLECLGYRVDAEGFHPVEAKVKAVKDALTPKNVSELKSFLGMINFYGKFLPNLASTLEPLHVLLRQNYTWKWGKGQEKAFQAAKDLLHSSRLLVHYDQTQELVLSCDASPYGVGAVLAQVMEVGSEKPVSCASRTLSKAEKNYSQLDKEALAVVFAVKKFHQFLYGRHFKIYTDHKPLLGLLSSDKAIPPMASGRVQRWVLTLSAYEYDLVYRPGRENGNAATR
ncbi:hypothetical protein QZH41_015051 [Actinostola sp. cb2023]|nr:hypothetical protein QZH41_015051 [Actinostola sp. cb2023]